MNQFSFIKNLGYYPQSLAFTIIIYMGLQFFENTNWAIASLFGAYSPPWNRGTLGTTDREEKISQ